MAWIVHAGEVKDAQCIWWFYGRAQKNVGLSSSVDIFYGINTISSDESISVLGMQRDCWAVDYNWWSTSAMKRWYDKSSGIVLKIQVVLYRQDITVEITETAIQTNIDFQS